MLTRQNYFEDLFEEAFRPLMASERRAWDFTPACDVEETEGHYLLSFDIPGIRKDDVKIEVTDHQLIVSGEKREEQREEKRNRYFSERSWGRFQRSFTLPATVDTSRIEADYADGVLKIAVPKAESVKPRTVRIGEAKTGGFFQKFLETSGKKIAS
jgi:HSP20 family protein